MSDLDWYLNKLRRKDIKDKPKSSLAWMLQQKDTEQAVKDNWERRNVCGKCNMVLATSGKCSMGCDE